MIRPALLVCLVAGAALAAEPPPAVEGAPGVPLFETPRLVEAEGPVNALLAEHRYAEAAAVLDQVIGRFPKARNLWLARAHLAALLNDPETAERSLSAAVDLGFGDAATLLARRPLDRFAGRPAMQDIAARTPPPPAPPPPVTPALAQDGYADIAAANSRWSEEDRAIRPQIVFPPRIGRYPVKRAKPEGVWADLQRLVSRGFAAGNVGDIYDNRDGGHSELQPMAPAQVTRTRYGPAARAAGLHYGLQEWILFPGAAFGNSSTAHGGARWRSQARYALTRPGAPDRLALQYATNQIYVYPEHNDHDRPEQKGRGDLFPANTPYVLISQGSSGSDQRLVDAVQLILAALPRDVKAALTTQGLIAPTVQQVFRRAMAPEGGYMTGAAHPTVFDGAKVDLAKMLALAQALRIGALPPLARLSVVEDGAPGAGFAGPLPERLFDTPHAVARAWRGPAAQRRYVLSGDASEDPNGRPLTYHWRLLRGDPAKVRITPLGEDGARAEVVADWTDGTVAADGMPSNRVDIGLFVDDGAAVSAPAFFSLTYPIHQSRVIRDGPRGPLTAEIADDPAGPVYADPVLWPRRPWRDVFRYAPDGALLGWTRRYPDGAAAEFDRNGLKVRISDSLGRPILAELIAYAVEPAARGAMRLAERGTERLFAYHYASDADLLARPTPVSSQ